MNYVSHTRAAHERLRRQPAARPHHVSLYWALFFEWNSARFPAELQIDRREVMAAARIGSRNTYLTTLRDLDTWKLLAYQPSHNGGSTIKMQSLDGQQVVAEVGQPDAAGCTRTDTTKKAAVVPELIQPVVAEVVQLTGEVVSEVGQHSLLVKTVVVNSTTNSGGGPEKKRREGFSDDELSSAEVLDDTAPNNGAVPPPDAAPKKKVAPKKKGVRAETIRAAATAGPAEPRRQRGPQQKPEVPFTESELATYAAFEATFAGTDYALLDLRFYHEKIINWRQKGEIPRRRDWKATATQFFLNDAQDNRLKLAPGVQRHEPGNSPSNTQQPGGPATGYRNPRWD